MCPADHVDEPIIEEVETEAEINDGPDDGRLPDPVLPTARPVSDLASELIRSLRVVFPEVDAVTKPIVIIAAGLKPLLAGKHALSHASVAAVIAEDEAGGGWIQGLAELLCEANAANRFRVLFQNARLQQKCAGFGGALVLAQNFPHHRLELADGLFNSLCHDT